MLRKLFALILLLTGIAALGQPAHARAFEAENAGLAAAANYAGTVKQGSAVTRVAGPRALRVARPDMLRQLRPIALPVPAVRLQADRARE